MIRVITQDGLAKYEISNYEIIPAEKNPMTRKSSYHIFTSDAGEKHLAAYSSLERAKEVFADMLDFEEAAGGWAFMMPLDELN